MATKPVKRTTQTTRKSTSRPTVKKPTSSAPKAAKPTKKLKASSTFGGPAKKTSQGLTNSPSKQRGGISRNLNKPKAQLTNKPKAKQEEAPQKTAAPDKQATGLGDWISGGLSKIKEGIGDLQPKPTAEERKALEGVRDMLEPSKLGGRDETFNFGDRKEIIKGLLQDKEGLKEEVEQQLEKEGKSWQIPFAKNAIDGKGLLAGRTMKKINSQVTKEMVTRLNAGLKEANIDTNTAKQVDTQKRDVTFEEMREFEQNTELLEAFQKRVADQVGFEVIFPNGISKEAIEHTLEGKFGIPPGGVIKGKE